MNFKKFESTQKLRGGYYTPADLADFLVRWVSARSPKRILEPSCGDGVFFTGVSQHLGDIDLQAFEIDEDEAAKAYRRSVDRGLSNTTITNDDFLGWAIPAIQRGDEQFDAVLGNPPFIRYQYLPPLFQERAEALFDELNCKFTKHTNAWVSFVLASMALLKPGGRLGMVLPAEIIHVMHAGSLRSYLGNECSRLVIIDPEDLWFEGTLQGVVLLLAEKKQSPRAATEGLGIYPVRGRRFVDSDPDEIFTAPQPINGKTVAGKWTRALLAASTRSLLDEVEDREDIQRFDEIAQVDVGIVTGANKFFLVDDDTVKRFKLEQWSHPMFGRSEHCPGVIYDEQQHELNALKGNPTNFLWFQDEGVATSIEGRSYIELGESQDLHTRYKCRIRKPWYTVPSVYSTDIGMLKRSHDAPRLILNRMNAFTTDTAYRIRSNLLSADLLVSSFINSLTAMSAELEGRHYGGGVLELVPSEIERLLIPVPSKLRPNVASLDKDIRSMSTEQVLEKQSQRILGGIGLSKAQQAEFLGGWSRLRNRRQRTSVEVES